MKSVVLGGGSWGTALALLLHRKGVPVTLWTRREERVREIRERRENTPYLPGVPIPEDLPITSDWDESLSGAEAVVIAVPSRAVGGIAERLGGGGRPARLYLVTSKGFDREGGRILSAVAAEHLPRKTVAVLAGPSHAEEVARRIPTTVVAAAPESGAARAAQELFQEERFRVYTNDDWIGVETAVALKNVIALAAGICDGLGFGDNTKGALLTRGLAEITRLGVALGARRETFAGLAGMGDLITTSISRHSRNRRFGEEIARGKKVEEIEREMVMVAEGVSTTPIAARLARDHGVETPITAETERVLFDGKDPIEAIEDLMARDPKAENW